MEKIRFIHAADLHIDTPFRGLKSLPQSIFNFIKESTFLSFQRLVDKAIAERIDFLIISGDLYDEENRSLRAQFFIKKQLERLTDLGIQVFIIHGNHDHLSGQWAKIEWPENVHFFTDEKVEMIPFKKADGPTVHLYGFSYPRKEVKEKMVQHYTKQGEATFHIGLLHGSIEGDEEHHTYAPFRLQDLKEKAFDYWALGHIHKREVLCESPLIIYPGNIQGRHKKETGEKGCYLIELSKHQQKYNFIPTADIIWTNETVSIEGLESIDMLINKVNELKESLRHDVKGNFLNIIIDGKGPLHPYFTEKTNVDDLIELLNEEEEHQSSFIWIVELKVNTVPDWDRDTLKNESNFVGDLLTQSDEYEEFQEALSTLFQHRKAKKYLTAVSKDEEKEIIHEAEKLILNELLKK